MSELKGNLAAVQTLKGGISVGGGGSKIELDTTLTQPGKAADAKAVGDALANYSANVVDYFLLKSHDGTVYKVTVTNEGALHIVDKATEGLSDLVPGRLLVWHDEFDAAEIDRSKWRSSTNASQYSELAAYTYQRAENAYIEDGQLVLRAVKDGYIEGRDWTSARLDTLGLFSAKYGRIEAKLKYEGKNGAFPAFWTLGSNTYYPSGEDGPYGVTHSWGAPWPYCGEIDIFEGTNGGNCVKPVLHYSLSPEETAQSTRYIVQESVDVNTSEYHIYSVEWTENEMAAYLDGVEIGRADTAGLLPYNKPHYLILNLCIGSIAGAPDEDVDEIKMHIDWVRVYAPESVTEKIDITDITLSRESVTMNLGDPAQYVEYLSAPDGAVNSLVTLESADPGVFTVYGTKLSPVAVGESELVATAYNGVTARIPVYVGTNLPVYAEGLSLNASSVDIVEGNTCQLAAAVVPNNCNETLVWETSDENVATVSDGLVTGTGGGVCTVTVYSPANRAVCASCSVAVEAATGLVLPKDGLVLQLDKTGMSNYAWTNSVDNSVLEWKCNYDNSTGESSGIIFEGDAFYFTGANYKAYSSLHISQYYSHSANQTLFLSFDSTSGSGSEFLAVSADNGTANSVRISAKGGAQYFGSSATAIGSVDNMNAIGKQTICLRCSDGVVTSNWISSTGETGAGGTLTLGDYTGDGVFKIGFKAKNVRHKACVVYNRVLTDDEVSTVLAAINEFVNG